MLISSGARNYDKNYEELWNNAVAYNEELAENGIKWTMTDEEKEEYDQYLKIDDTVNKLRGSKLQINEV